MSKPKTLQDLFAGLAGRGAAPAVIAFTDSGQKKWSGADIAVCARQLAAGLIERDGAKAVEPVALMAANSPEWIACFWGLVMAGRTVMPLDRQMAAPERQNCLAHSGCKRVFTTRQDAPCFDGAGLDAHLLDADADDARSWRALFGDENAELPRAAPTDTACLLYTSGTTGMPKGVPLSHANLIANVNAVMAEDIIGPADRVVLPLPLHHAYPLTVGLLSGLASGAVLVLPAGLGGPQLVQAARDGEATVMVAVPRLYAALLDGIRARASGPIFNALFALCMTTRRRWGVALGGFVFRGLRNRIGPRLRLLVSGGARLEPDAAWGLEALGWLVLSGYGLTETAPILTFNTLKARDILSVGRPVPGVDVRIAAEPGKREGEVLVRGPNVFAGYLDNPDATKQAFTDDGWFRTGDVGILDEDGFLRLTGRAGDLIVLADGKNIVPEEIETVYLHSPFIREMAVIERGGLLVGIIVPDEDAIRDYGAGRLEELMREEIDKGSVKLPSYRRIHGFVLWREALPRNPLGKLRRHLLGDIYDRPRHPAPDEAGRALSPEDRQFIADSGNAEVWTWLQKRYSAVPLTLDTSPQLDLDLDSLGWLNLTLEIDEAFAVRLDDEAVGRITTLRHLLEEIAAARAAEGRAPVSVAELEWIAPQSAPVKIFDRFLQGLAHVLGQALFRLRAHGLEHLPRSGPFIIVANHTSYLDAPCVYAALPRAVLERTYFAGWTGIMFANRFMRLISRASRTFPVDANRGVATAVALSEAVVRRGDVLVMFPEGRVSGSGEMLDFQPGIGLLAARTGAPIVPVLIEGAFEAMPRGWRLKRLHRVRLTFGAPLDSRQLLAEAHKDAQHADIARRVHDAVAALAKISLS